MKVIRNDTSHGAEKVNKAILKASTDANASARKERRSADPTRDEDPPLWMKVFMCFMILCGLVSLFTVLAFTAGKPTYLSGSCFAYTACCFISKSLFAWSERNISGDSCKALVARVILPLAGFIMCYTLVTTFFLIPFTFFLGMAYYHNETRQADSQHSQEQDPNN